jgi:hypothetical protein
VSRRDPPLGFRHDVVESSDDNDARASSDPGRVERTVSRSTPVPLIVQRLFSGIG